jgi:hypothetical protein
LVAAHLLGRNFFETPSKDRSGVISCNDKESSAMVKHVFAGAAQSAGAGFAEPVQEVFSWYGEDNEGLFTLSVSGQKASFAGISRDQVLSIRKHLENSGFIADQNNIAADVESKTTGHISGRTACLLIDSLDKGDVDGVLIEKRAAALICGSLCDDTYFATRSEAHLRKAIAERYGRPLEDVSVEVVSSEGNFLKGKYKTISDNKGFVPFFARKEGGAWKIVYDRVTRPDCSKLSGAGFPKEMIKECEKDNGSLKQDW